ncbi:hypothetical protein RHS01_04782 [Rhizoctonia solani]|uniref:Uncharacterized protein n=1 Tax=Rhizoctonia solani TaxID=456999 RepID=A0A8H7M624_9AGAM|nr:hypothetical protein RHS01_04782 [Rhizoctonia solani]
MGIGDFEFELLEEQGGNISSENFNQLLSQLKKRHSLDHIDQSTLGTALGELDIVYVVLRRGYLTQVDDEGKPLYTLVMNNNDVDYWLAGFGSLRFPNAARGDASAAEITVSLLSRAQRIGGGRLLVQKLLQHAFDTLRIRRVTASIVCPIQPHHSAEQKRRILFDTKELCWVFEKFGFKFEGVSRGAVESSVAAEDGKPVWHDEQHPSFQLVSHSKEDSEQTLTKSPWETMIRRHEEEKSEMQSWTTESRLVVTVQEGCEEEEEDSDNETVQGASSDSEWELPDDFDS